MNKAVTKYVLFGSKIICLQSHSNVEYLNKKINEQQITENNINHNNNIVI
jgi:hypothetical protein